jgi:hypothetical protein
MNQSWTPPAGYDLVEFGPEGAYLRAKYVQFIFHDLGLPRRGQNVVIVYLTDMGREVARTKDQEWFPRTVDPPKAPVDRWFRFRNGWLLVLQGLQEMIKSCHKK